MKIHLTKLHRVTNIEICFPFYRFSMGVFTLRTRIVKKVTENPKIFNWRLLIIV